MFRTLFLAMALLTCAPAAAQTESPAAPVQAEPALRARVDELSNVFNGTTGFESYFAPAFRAQVSRLQFEAMALQMRANYGPAGTVRTLTPLSPWAARATIGYRGGQIALRIAVDPNAPHLVTGLLVTGFDGGEASVDAVLDSFRKLPGRTGFAIARLGDGAPQVIAGSNPDTPIGVASAFKLVILAELVRATNAGERKWSDTVTIDGRPLAGGAYAMALKGMEFSLYDMAAKMISASDNSATDVLLHLIGREKLEKMLPVVGVTHAAQNRPLLGTLELFMLKGVNQGALARRYLALDEAGRRAMLDGEMTRLPLSAVDPRLFRDGKPVMVDELEWFFSPADLVRVMDWLRRNTASGPGAEARKILSINPGVAPEVAARWRFVGYKGGSEPGVMNMTLLLEGKDRGWYVVTGTWNNPAEAVDQLRMTGLIGRAAELVAP